MDTTEVMEKLNGLRVQLNEQIVKLPFTALAEQKITAGTREKAPILNRAIPWANHIACALVAVVLIGGIASCGGKNNSGGGGATVKASGKEAPASDFSYDMSKDGEGVVILKYTGKGGKVVIPAKIEGLPVVKLNRFSFRGEESSGGDGPGAYLTTVVIPASVKEIGAAAFEDCKNLTSVTILGTDVTLEGDWGGAFWDCINLSDLQFPENASLKGYSNTFSDCKKLPLAMRAKLKAMGFSEP